MAIQESTNYSAAQASQADRCLGKAQLPSDLDLFMGSLLNPLCLVITLNKNNNGCTG